MKVNHIPCGPAANESELRALECIKTRLLSIPGNDYWVILSNLAYSVTHQAQSDEIDIVCVGPTGVRVIEVKHWNPHWMKENHVTIEQEAERAAGKARKIGTTLRKLVPTLPHVAASILLTWESPEILALKCKTIRGINILSLDDWRLAVNHDAPVVLSRDEVVRLSRALEPRSAVCLDGTLTRFVGLVNLKLQTPKDERFHRIYRGIRSVQQDSVVLHLYDLSASQERRALQKARREFDAIHSLQHFRWAPRILDSFQYVPNYPGEMYFFTIIDPAAPSLAERADDDSWDTSQRIGFARHVIHALAELHSVRVQESNMVHRNLTASTIRVRHDGTPIFTGFDVARIPAEISVPSSSPSAEDWEKFAAPEVRDMGLAAADHRSDIYSLCMSLRTIFENKNEPKAREAARILSSGIMESPEDRVTLDLLERSLAELLDESVPPPSPPPARFWSEDQLVRFRDRDYRIVTRLGSGGVGSTFKVIEIDRSTKEDLGTYVAKVAYDESRAKQVLSAYALARSHLGRSSGLSAIYEVAQKWQENNFVALMTWIEGAPLADFTGVFPLLADEMNEMTAEELAVRWLRKLCAALDTLHKNGLIHGDVSPRNIIVSEGDVVLTDYDFVTRIGAPREYPGTVLYCSPPDCSDRIASASDDFYALAASLFHVFFDREPFQYGGVLAKERGLNWDGIKKSDYPILAPFLDRATHPESRQRFHTGAETRAALGIVSSAETREMGPEQAVETSPTPKEHVRDLLTECPSELTEQRVEWLQYLLQSYPGSRWGNVETRGLDTPFANDTYVETDLENMLYQRIKRRDTRLIILCGNAGDGKTALLQHLARRFGFGEHHSAERILEHRLEDGLTVRMNLDGSAAWRGRSSDQLLDEFLNPFQQGLPRNDIAHLLAVNDGRLLEWIETVEERNGGMPTPLTKELYDFLQEDDCPSDSHICFISLNRRSLVGGIKSDCRAIQADFVHRLLDRLYGGGKAREIWNPCLTCSAKSRCEIFRALTLFGPDQAPIKAHDDIRRRARERLLEALQAVHLRGEVHITARELRAALVYVLFGLHYCDDYHGKLENRPLSYWDLAFDPNAPGRQGEVLRELARFDPALEAHPQIDRHLLSESTYDTAKAAPCYGTQMSLASVRRRAFFEWSETHQEEVARDSHALGLAAGRHLALFRRLPIMDEAEREKVCQRLCRGISRLEDLPPQALDRAGVVPLRITPRTPTETAFWVEKPFASFRLEPDLPPFMEGLDRLHRQAWLVYRYRDGNEERLRLGAELFHLLLELSEGFQLGDVSSDDTFAHLSIFVQRLAHEDEREIMAWNPMQDEVVFKIAAHIEEGNQVSVQQLVLRRLETAEEHP